MGVLLEVTGCLESTGFTVSHLDLLLSLISLLLNRMNSLSLCYDRNVRLGFKMAEKLSTLLEMHGLLINKSLKYVMLLDKGDSTSLMTPLHATRVKNNLLHGQCVLSQGIYK